MAKGYSIIASISIHRGWACLQGTIEYFPLKGRSCCMYCPPGSGTQRLPVVIMPIGIPMLELLPVMAEIIENSDCNPFYLAVFEVTDWQNDCTPWPAPPLKKNGRSFGGCGKRTLQYICEFLIPELERRWPLEPGPEGHMLAGYSLAGLLALWAGYSCTEFGGVASCSGSLWYDGWAEYMETHRAKGSLRVYLSMGRCEENTHNPRMQAVGNNTRTAEWHCNQDANVTRHTLYIEPGGHFHDPAQRLARALIWLNR